MKNAYSTFNTKTRYLSATQSALLILRAQKKEIIPTNPPANPSLFPFPFTTPIPISYFTLYLFPQRQP